LKILLYGINYAPELTGVGKYTGEMGEWLASRGHQVRVVTAPPYYPAWEVGRGYSSRVYRRELVADADVWRCPLWVPRKPSGLKRLAHLASFAASSLPVVLSQVRWRPDVLVLIQPPLLCAPHAWLTARLSGARLWLHIQDFELDAALGLGMLGGRGARRILYGVEKLLLQTAERVSTISEAMRRRLVEKGIPEDRALLFPNWSDLDFVRPKAPNNAVRSEFGAGPEDVLVLYTGNMGEKQGLDLVLDAADRLRNQPEIKFALVGTGVARKELEQAALTRRLDRVRFFPLQPLERLPLMLAGGDIHLLVQRPEAADLLMPSKLTNTLAAGRPSIATADPGTALYEVLHDYDCGVTTKPGSVEGLVTGIVSLAHDARMRERLGKNARRCAEYNLDKEKILAEFEEALLHLRRKES
jgi:colanic acid biosynthesis glycosyl transferase WcaI